MIQSSGSTLNFNISGGQLGLSFDHDISGGQLGLSFDISGGQLGLWIGISVISMCEILTYLAQLFQALIGLKPSTAVKYNNGRDRKEEISTNDTST